MTATAHMRGHPVYFDPDHAVWRHQSDDTIAPSDGGEERPCVRCGLTAGDGYGPDPCVGRMEGYTAYCCGHGLVAAFGTPTGGACGCWWQVVLHGGHCCFRVLPGDYVDGSALPCGHVDPR